MMPHILAHDRRTSMEKLAAEKSSIGPITVPSCNLRSKFVNVIDVDQAGVHVDVDRFARPRRIDLSERDTRRLP